MPVRERRDDLRSLYTPGSRKYWALKSDSARVLYNALKANADDEGLLEGDVEDVEALVPRARNVGWTTKSIGKDLEDLVSVGLIERYSIDSRSYIHVCMFAEKQQWTRVSAEQSSLPQPPSRKETQVAVASRSFISATPTHPMDGLLPIQTKPESFAAAPPNFERVPGSASRISQSAHTTFINSKTAFRRKVGKSLGSLGNRGSEWERLCEKHTGETVESAVRLWCQELGKGGRDLRWPLAVFLKQAEEWIAEAVAVATSATSDCDSEESDDPFAKMPGIVTISEKNMR